MMIVKIVFSIISLILTTSITEAQIVPRVQGLEKDSVYMSLLLKENELVSKQDSLRKIISSKRALMNKSPEERDQFSKEIVALETQLFDISGLLGGVTSKTNVIEKEFILKNINTIASSEQASEVNVKGVKNFILDPYFVSNIPKPDYMAIVAAAKTETVIVQKAAEIKELYMKYKDVYNSYKTASDVVEADSIRNIFKDLHAKIDAKDAEVGDLWQPLYQVKYDTYNVLLDKLSAYNEIEKLNDRSRNRRSEIADVRATVVSPELSSYLRGKLLLIDYELALSSARNIKESRDSLSALMRNTDIAMYDFEDMKLPSWTFISYEPVKANSVAVYSSTNEIEELVIPTVGELYSINIGTYPKKQTSYSIFRKLSPIGYREEDGGKYSYFAGTYKTYDEAKKGYDYLKRLGMKATIYHWKDSYQIADDGFKIDIRPSGDAFRVEIPALTAEIKSIISETEPEKEIIEVNTENGRMFSVGIFSDFESAKGLATKLGVTAKVIGIKSNSDE